MRKRDMSKCVVAFMGFVQLAVCNASISTALFIKNTTFVGYLPVTGFQDRILARSAIDCNRKCKKDSQCVSFFFVKANSMCQTHRELVEDQVEREAISTAVYYTKDDNECMDNTDNCHPNATCTNTTGSFKCACNSGYTGDGVTNCTDADECTDNTDNCHADATCTNTVGSFMCACNSGYTGDGVTTCTDDYECAGYTDNCHADATCTNTAGSFTMSCACNSGYTGDGVTCTDFDECADNSDNCHADATCTNTAGSFTCACSSGYTGDGVTTCTDDDECKDKTDNCHADATCANTAGSFTCACNSGLYGDGVTTCTVYPTFTCPPDDTIYRTVLLTDNSLFTYKVFLSSPSHDVAQSNCSADGGHLVRLTSSTKMDVLLQLTNTCPGYDRPYYRVDLTNTNAVDIYNINQWVSSAGDPLPIDNDFWTPGRPVDPETLQCGYLGDTHYYQLADSPCDYEMSYICEKDV